MVLIKGPSVKPMHTRKKGRRKPNVYLGTNTINEDSGLYVDLEVNGVTAKFLVDTGATISLISNALFEKFKSSDSPEIRQINQEITTANGTPVCTRGTANVTVKLGNCHSVLEVVIADLTVDGILGLDFLKNNRCTIDLEKGVLVWDQQKIPIVLHGLLGVYRVVAKDSISIAPRSEVVCPGRVLDHIPNCSETGLVEPCEELLGKDKALVAKTLIQDSEIVPVRLMNVTDDVKIIPAGTVVGKLSKANIIEGQNKSDKVNMSRELENLLDRTSKNLSRDQEGEVCKLLKEFRNLFAVSDNDLGHTNIVKHKIDTGDYRPIKQPPRRTPVALRE